MNENTEAVALTADIVSAYVSNNSVEAGDLAMLINQVHQALTQAAEGKPAAPEAPPSPAVPVKKSITPEYLISLEDGRKYKSLKRHLSTRGMSPDDYRTKWGLAKDYPMVAASYSAQRSSLAKSLGLGRPRAGADAEASDTPVVADEAPSTEETVAAEPAAKPARGRKAKAA